MGSKQEFIRYFEEQYKEDSKDDFLRRYYELKKVLSSTSTYDFSEEEINQIYTNRFIKDQEEFATNLEILISPAITDDTDDSEEESIVSELSDYSTGITLWLCYSYLLDIISGKEYHGVVSLEVRRDITYSILEEKLKEINRIAMPPKAYRLMSHYLNELLYMARSLPVEHATNILQRSRKRKSEE